MTVALRGLVGQIKEGADFAVTGLFAQAKWDLNPRLSLTGGLRLDLVDSGTRPPLNNAVLSTFGIRNDGTVDGTQIVSPRFGFNWAADDARTTQVRGGVGYFTGRAPFVFISNAYGNSGVGRFNQVAVGATAPSLSNQCGGCRMWSRWRTRFTSVGRSTAWAS